MFNQFTLYFGYEICKVISGVDIQATTNQNHTIICNIGHVLHACLLLMMNNLIFKYYISIAAINVLHLNFKAAS